MTNILLSERLKMTQKFPGLKVEFQKNDIEFMIAAVREKEERAAETEEVATPRKSVIMGIIGYPFGAGS